MQLMMCSNGKIERFHGTLKRECVRPRTPVSLEDARAVVGRYIEHYNNERLHSAIGYLAPLDVLEGRAEAIRSQRRRKLQAARLQRARPHAARSDLTPGKICDIIPPAGETETGSAGEQPDRGIAGRDVDAKFPAPGGPAGLPSAPRDIAEKVAHA